MIIIRYSLNKFETQYQSHHLKDVEMHLNNFDINIFPECHREAMIQLHKEKVKFYKDNYDDLQYGVWAFIDGHKCNQALNHLTKKVPHWKAEISDETIVIDNNWSKKLKITDYECKYFGFFIPKSQLCTLNIYS